MNVKNIDDILASKLHKFLPKKVFDIHAHIYRVSDLHIDENDCTPNKAEGDWSIDTWKENVGKQLGKGKLSGGLFMPFPAAHCDIDSANAFLLEQLNGFPESRGLIMVSPDSSYEKVAEYLVNENICGFKPYHLFSRYKPTNVSPISGYLPEWVWKLANERRLVIMLHLVKSKALADPVNQREIIEKCRKYPNVKLILAHAGRGFYHRNTVEGILKIRGIQNIWFDTSAICEPTALKAVLNEFGPGRLLWGSDFPISQKRGKCISLGQGFAWILEDNLDWNKIIAFCQPTLVGIEALLALKEAAEDFGLNSRDMNDLFYNNALSLLGMKVQ